MRAEPQAFIINPTFHPEEGGQIPGIQAKTICATDIDLREFLMHCDKECIK